MTLFLSSILLIAAWLALALAMDRHQRDLLGKVSRRSADICRFAGWGLLLLSAVPPVVTWGMLTGATVWIALMSIAAICVVLAITLSTRAPVKSGKRVR